MLFLLPGTVPLFLYSLLLYLTWVSTQTSLPPSFTDHLRISLSLSIPLLCSFSFYSTHLYITLFNSLLLSISAPESKFHEDRNFVSLPLAGKTMFAT